MRLDSDRGGEDRAPAGSEARTPAATHDARPTPYPPTPAPCNGRVTVVTAVTAAARGGYSSFFQHCLSPRPSPMTGWRSCGRVCHRSTILLGMSVGRQVVCRFARSLGAADGRSVGRRAQKCVSTQAVASRDGGHAVTRRPPTPLPSGIGGRGALPPTPLPKSARYTPTLPP